MTLALVVAIPLAAAVGIAVMGGRLGRRTLGLVATFALTLSFGAASSMIASLRDRPTIEAFVAPWLPIPGADLALVVDSSMLAVTLAITGVAALVALYSIGYLARDRGPQRYFVAFVLLVVGMLLVVLGSNLALVIVGWELAGVAAYLLVGHHRDNTPAARAAIRMFVIERVGDAALIGGTLLLLAEFHTVDIAQLGSAAIEHGGNMGALAVLASALILIGALAKSAQPPLHVWLPDSTEAAAPVSALIQTVAVTGGVVLLMRLRSVLAPDVLQAAAIIGGVTAFGGALAATAQRDIRRALAWSTISQVGLMFVAAGLGALFAARLQLIAHALLKAVLVLGAGSVRRATGDESDVTHLGGLGRRMPWTAGAFAIGVLALAGIPPAAGFFAITAIVSAAFSESEAVLTALVLLTVAASAFAAVRLFALTFVAPPTLRRDAHEAPPLQDVPLTVLALGALGFGALVSAGLPIGSGPTDEAPIWLLFATFTVALIGAAAAWLGYRHGPGRAECVDRAMRWARPDRFGAIYGATAIRPFERLARKLEVGAERVNDCALNGVGSVAMWAAARVRGPYLESGRAQQALLLAGTVVLLTFWIGSAR